MTVGRHRLIVPFKLSRHQDARAAVRRSYWRDLKKRVSSIRHAKALGVMMKAFRA